MIDMTSFGSGVLLLMSVLNLIMCLAIAWSCLCRLAAMNGVSTQLRFRVSYTLFLVCSMASGLSPVMFKEHPGPGTLMLSFALLFMVGVGYGTWKDGVPDCAKVHQDQDQDQDHKTTCPGDL